MKKINLEDRKNKEVFKVPNGYFEDFETRLLQRIESETPQPKTRQLKPIIIYLVAASITIALCIPFLYNTPTFSTISDEDIESYLDYNITYEVKADILNTLDTNDYIELEKEIKIDNKDLNDYLLSQIDVEYYLNPYEE